MAHFVNPVVSEDGTYLGSNIENHSEGLWKQDQGYVQLEDGRHVNAFADIELETESEDQGGFDFDSYSDTLIQLYPTLPDAIQFAASGQAHGFDVKGFNDALERQDLNTVNEQIERLLSIYQESVQQPEVQEEDRADDFFTSEVETLRNAEYTPEQAQQLGQAAAAYEEGTPEHYILSVGQFVARGELTFDQAFETASQFFSQDELVAAYQQLQHTLN